MPYRFSLSKYVLAGALVAITLGVIPISGTSYGIGVKVGDWTKYEVAGTVPSISDYDWVRLEVQNVNGTEIAILATIHYKNGAEETNSISWDIEAGREPWIVPANLNEGDPFPFRYDTAVINDTLIKTYAGASRTVNLLNLSEYDEYTEMIAYWDQVTGILLELFLNCSSPTESWTGGYKAIETNLWSPTPQMTMELSSETVTRGDLMTVSSSIVDLAGNPIEGATVTVYIGDKAVDLGDLGDGFYEVDIDTSDVIEGTYEITVSAHKEGLQPIEVFGTLRIETRILHVTIQVSTDTATQGDIVTVSATVKDLAENPIEGATVLAILDHKTVTLSDQGSGNYEGNIDTFDVSEGTYLVTVTAEKELCESAQNAETLNVKAAIPWLQYTGIGIAAIALVIVAVILYKRR